MEKLWTTSEVAQFLGIPEADVERLVQEGQLTGYQLGGQFLRFRPDQVQALKAAIRPHAAATAAPPKAPWFHPAQDFFYFYDFYIISATLLAALVVYLIASG